MIPTNFSSAINIQSVNNSLLTQIKQRKQSMASRFPESEPSLHSNPFQRAELLIKSTFNSLIKKLEERRDQLLVELDEMSANYFSKEETRKKQIKDLDQLIRGIEEATIKQNPIVDLQKQQIQKIQKEKEEFLQSNPTPLPQLDTSLLGDLLQKIEMFGSLQDVAPIYHTKVHPIWSIGKYGKGKVELNHPRGVATDEKGNIFIADMWSSRIQLVSLEGQFIGEFGKGELGRPHSITLYNDWLFVTDCHLNEVLKYKTQNYKFERKSESELSRPSGITVDNNEVFVADCNNSGIVVLSLDLKFIRELGNKKLVHPQDVKVNDNKVFVADNSKHHNVHVFSKLGDLLNSIITLRSETGNIFICFDKFNNILISDSSGKIIQIYTLEGQLIHSIECDYTPEGIAVTQNNIIICVDIYSCKFNLY